MNISFSGSVSNWNRLTNDSVRLNVLLFVLEIHKAIRKPWTEAHEFSFIHSTDMALLYFQASILTCVSAIHIKVGEGYCSEYMLIEFADYHDLK